jgi:hypothetical protein
MIGSAYRQGLAETFLLIRPTHFVTLTTNGPWFPPEKQLVLLRSDLRQWLAKLDRQLLGRNWWKKPVEARVDGLFVVEGLCAHPHLHGTLRLPEGRTEADLQSIGESAWESVCPSGEFRAEPIYSGGVGGYIAKAQTPASELIFAREFHPNPQ